MISQEGGLVQSVPLATKRGISVIILPLMILQQNLTHTTDTFLFISHTMKVLLFKFRCSIFIGGRIVKEMLGLVASGTLCIIFSFSLVSLLRLIKKCLNETYSRGWVEKHLCNTFPTKKGLKQDNALSPLILNFDL